MCFPAWETAGGAALAGSVGRGNDAKLVALLPLGGSRLGEYSAALLVADGFADARSWHGGPCAGPGGSRPTEGNQIGQQGPWADSASGIPKLGKRPAKIRGGVSGPERSRDRRLLTPFSQPEKRRRHPAPGTRMQASPSTKPRLHFPRLGKCQLAGQRDRGGASGRPRGAPSHCPGAGGRGAKHDGPSTARPRQRCGGRDVRPTKPAAGSRGRASPGPTRWSASAPRWPARVSAWRQSGSLRGSSART